MTVCCVGWVSMWAIFGGLSLLSTQRTLVRGAPFRMFTRRNRVSRAKLPWNTNRMYGGFGGEEQFGESESSEQIPIVFVHGNTRTGKDWLPVMESFREQGIGSDALWAITFRQKSPSHPEMSQQLDDFVANVRQHTGAEKVHVVGHSLGVTGLRYWINTFHRYDWVDSFVGISGANHGTATAEVADRLGLNFGKGRAAEFLNPKRLQDSDHPLAKLNLNETPGDIDYYTVRATCDTLFQLNPESPMLEGAIENIEVDATHTSVQTDPVTVSKLYEWLASSECN